MSYLRYGQVTGALLYDSYSGQLCRCTPWADCFTYACEDPDPELPLVCRVTLSDMTGGYSAYNGQYDLPFDSDLCTWHLALNDPDIYPFISVGWAGYEAGDWTVGIWRASNVWNRGDYNAGVPCDANGTDIALYDNFYSPAQENGTAVVVAL